MQLVCSECGAPPASATARELSCSGCGGLFEFVTAPGREQAPAGRPADERTRRVEPGALRRALASRSPSSSLDPLDASGVWRYRELLPPIPPDAVVTLRENVVPLYPARTGAQHAGITRLAYLHLGMNPTGSFKDAGMTVAISSAKANGARVAVCASTGNTAASMAAYCARAGIAALVLVPAGGVSEAKMAQTLDYGAQVVAVEGDFDRALAMVRALDPARVAVVNSVNPYRIEGQKCAALALLEARGWRVPDWVVMPGGNLGNSSAFGKGFREALELGLIDRLPRLAVVQAAGAAPFARAFATGEALQPVVAQTAATAIRIGAPASWRKALREVRASGGTVLAVADGAIAEARAIVGRDGVGCEPASAASLAGARALRDAGTIAPDDDVVLVLTGHVLKDTGYAAAYHASDAARANHIVSIPAGETLDALIERIITAERVPA